MRLPLALAACLLLAGCTAPTAPPSTGAPGAPGPTMAPPPPTVVAVIDTGINPYHERFRAGPGGPSFADVPGFPADALAIGLTFDAADYDAAVERDAAAWAQVQAEQLVVFPGTRTAGISIVPAVEDSPYPVLDDAGHGTAVADSVFEAAPHAVVVSVQIRDDEDIVPAMRWAAGQPWIDIVSVSWGKYLNEYAEEPDIGLADAYREAARAGKVLVNSAGNEPTLHWTDEHNGPPFVIAVGGADNATQGEVRTAARSPDVIAAYVQDRARLHSYDEAGPIAGTSFSAPTVSGTLAEALWLVRSALNLTTGGTSAQAALAEGAGPGAFEDGVLTAEELRGAMNLRAELWGPQDWQVPTTPGGVVRSQPVVAQAEQAGWGFVEPAQATDIAAHLLGTATLPPKPPEVVAYMERRQAAREAAWGGA